MGRVACVREGTGPWQVLREYAFWPSAAFQPIEIVEAKMNQNEVSDRPLALEGSMDCRAIVPSQEDEAWGVTADSKTCGGRF